MLACDEVVLLMGTTEIYRNGLRTQWGLVHMLNFVMDEGLMKISPDREILMYIEV